MIAHFYVKVNLEGMCYTLTLSHIYRFYGILVVMIHYVYAAGDPAAYAQSLLAKANAVIIFPLISLMMGVAFLIFLYGAFEYVRNADSQQGRIDGRNHLIWGIVGMLIMISAFAILNIAAGTFGLQSTVQTYGPGGTAGTNTIPPASNLPSGATAPGYGGGNTPLSNSGYNVPAASTGNTPLSNSGYVPLNNNTNNPASNAGSGG